MCYLVVFIIGYLLGSFNMSLLLSKFYGKDVRKHGSGNAGTTNTLRTFGKKAAVVSFIGDLLKGILACLAGYYLANQYLDTENGLLIAGLGSIIGHNWPLYFGFKGGKGVLTTFAVLLMMDWKIALTLFGIFIICVIIFKIVALGSVSVAVLFPIISYIGIYGEKSYFFIGISILLSCLVIFRHLANIKRIIKGTESKLGKSKAK